LVARPTPSLALGWPSLLDAKEMQGVPDKVRDVLLGRAGRGFLTLRQGAELVCIQNSCHNWLNLNRFPRKLNKRRQINGMARFFLPFSRNL
jgi:hypothetical protein